METDQTQSTQPFIPPIPSSSSPTLPLPKPSSSKLSFVIITIILFALISVAGYFAYLHFYPHTTSLPVPTIQPSEPPLPIDSPSPSPSPEITWKKYVSKNSFQVMYPSDWVITTDSLGFAVVKNDYQVKFDVPSSFKPKTCIFSDNPNYNSYATSSATTKALICPGDFKEISAQKYTFRRKLAPDPSPSEGQNLVWSIFNKDSNGNFVTLPPISYQTPTSYNTNTVLLMDQILSTFVYIDSK